MACKKTVHEDCCPVRDDRQFDFRGDRRNLHPEILLQDDSDDLFSSGLNGDLLCKVLITSLAYHDLVLARQQQNLFRPLQLFQIPHVLPVNPYSRGFLHLGGADELDLPQDIIPRVEKWDEDAEDTEKCSESQKFDPARACHISSLLSLPVIS